MCSFNLREFSYRPLEKKIKTLAVQILYRILNTVELKEGAALGTGEVSLLLFLLQRQCLHCCLALKHLILSMEL